MLKKIAENFNRLSKAHQRHRQTDRQTDLRSHIANVNASSRPLKTGDLASRSERNAALISTLSEAFRNRHKEYTNLRILAANEDTLLATKSCDALHHVGSSSFLCLFVNLILAPVPPSPGHVFLHPPLLPRPIHHFVHL